ncbi:MAG TPA: CRISPR-associated endonuclease Cas1 [Ghiorsea sp.]|nr:CRISPR-associated endonuclease Cas1 [Ghiorsea sp.]
MLPIQTLLPLRAINITLRFSEPSRPQVFHQPALTAFIRHLSDCGEDYDKYFTLDAPESGQTHYQQGDEYTFTLMCLAGGEKHLQHLLEQLQQLPFSAPITDNRSPFRNNLRFAQATDFFNGSNINTLQDAIEYDDDKLTAETYFWQQQNAAWCIRYLSPVRLLRDKAQRETSKGEKRYCRTEDDLQAELLSSRLYQGIADLLRRRGQKTPSHQKTPELTPAKAHLFWFDFNYYDARGNRKPMGGMSGKLCFSSTQKLPEDWLKLLVLGQYLGIGQRRAFGWGHYQLESVEGEATYQRPQKTQSLLTIAAHEDNIQLAWKAIKSNQKKHPEYPQEQASDEQQLLKEQQAQDEYLHRMAGKLATGKWHVPPLDAVFLRKPNGEIRNLTIPPFWDRVMQRAVAQKLSPILEQFFYKHSYGYRPGKSRHGAADAIGRAYRDGYRWVYESDIEDFFNSVNREHLLIRLHALLGDDPIIPQIMQWMAAYIDYQGHHIQRPRGLPQGSPLSPLLANFILDDFDSDLQNKQSRLVRFADDFVILCKTQQQAELAAQQVKKSLEEIELQTNPDKTRIVPFEQGFRYLSYLFMNDVIIDSSARSHSMGTSRSKSKVEYVPAPDEWLAKIGKRKVSAIKQPINSGKHSQTGATGTTSGEQFHAGAVGTRDKRCIGTINDDGTLLVITGKATHLSQRNKRLALIRENEKITEVPYSQLQSVLMIGTHHITTPAIRGLLRNNIPVHFTSTTGRYQGTLWSGEPASTGHQLWLRQQQRCMDEPACLQAAISLMESRLRHQREVIRQYDTNPELPLTKTRNAFTAALQKLPQVTNLAELNGIEGSASRSYYAAFRQLVPENYDFDGRNRRPPRDPFNVLLSLGYTLLYAHTESLLRVDGLLPWTGFYHQSHGRHAALASDLMEPFRHIIERLALASVRRNIIKAEDFSPKGNGIWMNNDARKRWLGLIEERFTTETTALGEEQAYTLHQHLHQQNRRLIQWIDNKSPFHAWRMR